jgi:hypothetical protein
MRPIKVKGSVVSATMNYSYSLQSLSVFLPENTRYVFEKDIYWSNGDGKKHLIKKGTPKSVSATEIMELRRQFIPACCDADSDPKDNYPVGIEPGSSSQRDIIYRWHFVHRHGFPSDIHGSGRGQRYKVKDILKHPLSYMLMCDEHHEEYDRENGEWKNPKNREKYSYDGHE